MKAASRYKTKSKPTPGEIELNAIFREMDKGRKRIKETAEVTREIQEEIRKYRAERRSRK